MAQAITESLRFHYHSWRRSWSNFSLLRHRACDGHLVSMHQSGTHWLKFMLANAMAYQFGTPPPEFNHANDIIGGPRDAQVYPQLPRLVSSHTVPHYIATLAAVHRHFRLPPYVLLLRDMRVALVSNYHKWRDRYGIPFAEFLSGDPSGAIFNSDIWWAIRFLNGWGDVYANAAPRIVVVKYEDLAVDAAAELRRVAAHFNLALSAAAIAAGVEASSKSAMQDKHDPARPPGAVRDDCADPFANYSAADRELFERLSGRYLRHRFGYDYSTW